MTTDIDWTPDDTKLRQFGYVATVGFGLIGTVLFFRHSPSFGYAIWSLAILCPIFSLIWPRANKPVYLAMCVIGLVVGTIISTILLGSLFLLVFVPIALVFKAKKRDVLQRTIDRDCKSYWIDRPEPRPAADYYRQF